MTARIYIALFDTASPVEPRFHGGGAQTKGAVEILRFDDFQRLDEAGLRRIAGELARVMGRPDLIPASRGRDRRQAMPADDDEGLPELNFHDPEEMPA